MMDYGVNPEQRVTNISDSDKIKNFFPYFIAGSVDRYFFFPCRVQFSIENVVLVCSQQTFGRDSAWLVEATTLNIYFALARANNLDSKK